MVVSVALSVAILFSQVPPYPPIPPPIFFFFLLLLIPPFFSSIVEGLLERRKDLDNVIIETTGLADPGSVAGMLVVV